jgi:hypothetical protein
MHGIHRLLVPVALALAALPAAAQDSAETRIGPDAYRAGDSVVLQETGIDDTFLAGGSVTLVSDVAGSAHLAGRTISVEGEVARDLYAAGMDIELGAPVAGDATLAGYDLRVSAAVGGDLRAAGSRVSVTAPVGETAVLAGERVTLGATIGGDASIAGDDLTFGADARVDGILTLYAEDPAAVEVPPGVAPAERIERRALEEFEGVEGLPGTGVTVWGMIAGFLGGVIAMALIATVIAALVPRQLAGMRRGALGRPFHTIWIGFLALSALIGAGIVLLISVVGIFVSPAMAFLAGLLGFAGYVIGAYSLGAGLLGAVGRGEPDSLGQRALAAFVGALVAGLVALIPLLGWVFVLGLVLMGAGALVDRLFRPRFFAETGAA